MENLNILNNTQTKNIYIKRNSISNKYYIILFIFLILIISSYIYINFSKKHKRIIQNDLNSNDLNQTNKKGNNKFIKLNSYNIYMDNVEDLYTKKIFFISPFDNCPKTYFFKPKYTKEKHKYFDLKETNITLISSDDYESIPTYISEKVNETRKMYFKKLGFKLFKKMNFANIYLTPYTINTQLQNELNTFVIDKYQKINKFYNYKEYVSKSLLYRNYKIFKDKFPSDFNYMFESYSYPEDKKIIETKFKNYTLNISDKDNKDLWLIKPKLGSLGDNIQLFTNLSNVKSENYILTKYLSNPHLIRHYKYDFRFYGLVSTIKPLKLYLYNEGFLRIATEKFNFSFSDLKNKYAFLTNIFINKQNKNKYIYPENILKIEDSNLWNFETFQNYCKRKKIDYNKIYSEVSDIFIKMIITVREKLIEEIIKNKLKCSNFYHLIGFDIILDNNLKPYLLEANRRCQFRDDNEAEKYYTYNIFTDTLNIIGIREYNYKNLNDGSNKTKEDIKENIEESLCELNRPRGGYNLIFPLKNNINKYKKFFGSNIPKEDRELWKKIKE